MLLKVSKSIGASRDDDFVWFFFFFNISNLHFLPLTHSEKVFEFI